MKITKLSMRDSGTGDSSRSVNPENFNSEFLLGPHKINNINILVKNLYYLGYKDPKSVADQLKLRGMDIDSDAKSSIKKCLQDLEDNQDQSSKK